MLRDRIYTIGYEKSSAPDFLSTLAKLKIELVLDIRELPISRKKGFAKSSLSSGLANYGIEYLHLKALGDPKPGRLAARAGDFETFRKIFGTHLETDAAQDALNEAMVLAEHKTVCLLCFERCHEQCHRSMVADVFEVNGFSVSHVGVQPIGAEPLGGIAGHDAGTIVDRTVHSCR